ncbi:ELAV 3 isoform X8 [Brachionus plicatilis]|uniref:ELAV 3 isoform X8 n=1 Tax=Brachionus plicatilis TaxID=10195 RepID=A0A3M7RQG1_BRAPC|nr:ELAV 3 isoform X8 [Brachionus plicatilis]
MENVSLIDSCGGSNNLSNSISNTSTDESRTNLIVNYLPQSMSNEELKTLFQSVGPLDSCKLIKNKLNNQSLCYGFINYSNLEDAEKAIKTFNGLKIENKIIKVSYARPSSDNIKGANLYVCGIPKLWGLDELNSYFSQCGRIITSRILLNSSTGQSKGVGFVRYDQKKEAEIAIVKLNGKMPNGSHEPMLVKFASYPNEMNLKYLASIPLSIGTQQSFLNAPKLSANYSIQTAALSALRSSNPQLLTTAPQQFPFYRNDLFCNENQAFQSLITNHANIIPSTPNSCVSTPPILSNPQISSSPSPGWSIFVYNLAPDTEENVLWQLFGPYGAVQSVKIVKNFSNQKSKGFGFVTMTSYEEALNAINSLNGINIGNRILQVSFKSS